MPPWSNNVHPRCARNPFTTSAKLEQVALSAARAAGRIHLQRLSRIKVTRKTNAIDLVTEADRESEQAVIRTLNRAFPDHAILAEESGANARQSAHRWIIDPLDGTTNFRSSACRSLTGVADGSSLRRCSTRSSANCSSRRAAAARGSTDGRSSCSATPSLYRALLATAFPYDQRERRNFYLTFWEAFMMRTQGVRHTGSAVLDLCYVAWADGWEFGLRSRDVAAGAQNRR